MINLTKPTRKAYPGIYITIITIIILVKK